MNGLNFGRIRGIPLRADITFLIALPALAFLFSGHFVMAARMADVPAESLGGSPYLWGLGVALGLFASVLAHELAHSLYALRKGGRVEDITLLMIGGVSRISHMPARPRHQALVALVGPLTSLGLGAGFYVLHRASAGLASPNLVFALFCLAQLNLVLGVFNLLPAFPMDGGRILRALLVRRQGPLRATQTAARVGSLFAVLFAAWGLFTFNWLLVFVAYFVWTGARAEAAQELAQDILGRVGVGELMAALQADEAIAADASLQQAAGQLHASRRSALPVLEGPGVIGLLSLEALETVERSRWLQVRAREAAQPARCLSATDSAWTALQALQETGARALPVLDAEGRLAGLLTHEDVERGMRLGALHAGAQRTAGDWAKSPREAHS